MTTAESIRKFGFKRWYERALIESHAYLVTAFLGMIVTFAAIELIGARESFWHMALGVASVAFGAAITLFGIRRYFRLLALAENLGDRATCRRCNTYAAFNIVASAPKRDDDAAESGAPWIRVKCRKCDNEWII